jgi:hypothetical protein
MGRNGSPQWASHHRYRGRVTFFRPFTIDPTGVTLYRWPMRSVFIPLERVDRFDVVLGQAEAPGNESQRLVLLTRDGKMIFVQTTVIQWLRWRGLSPGARAQELNNLIAEKRREARPSDGGRL